MHPSGPNSNGYRKRKTTDVFYGISAKEKRMLTQMIGSALIVNHKSKSKLKSKSTKRTETPSAAVARRS